MEGLVMVDSGFEELTPYMYFACVHMYMCVLAKLAWRWLCAGVAADIERYCIAVWSKQANQTAASKLTAIKEIAHSLGINGCFFRSCTYSIALRS